MAGAKLGVVVQVAAAWGWSEPPCCTFFKYFIKKTSTFFKLFLLKIRRILSTEPTRVRDEKHLNTSWFIIPVNNLKRVRSETDHHTALATTVSGGGGYPPESESHSAFR